MPYYRLKELMYAKYGEEKFAIACIIVAQWVNMASKHKKCTAQTIERMCNLQDHELFILYHQEAEALRQLFGLQSITELYTLPETAPQNA